MEMWERLVSLKGRENVIRTLVRNDVCLSADDKHWRIIVSATGYRSSAVQLMLISPFCPITIDWSAGMAETNLKVHFLLVCVSSDRLNLFNKKQTSVSHMSLCVCVCILIGCCDCLRVSTGCGCSMKTSQTKAPVVSASKPAGTGCVWAGKWRSGGADASSGVRKQMRSLKIKMSASDTQLLPGIGPGWTGVLVSRSTAVRHLTACLRKRSWNSLIFLWYK